jgi:hypothetical protein
MSVGQMRAAARKMKLRYKRPGMRSVAEGIAAERRKAAKAAAVKKK